MPNNIRMELTTNKRGLTIIELIIAISLAAALLASVFYFWNFLNRHAASHTSNALFSTESHRIINSIGSQIRNAKTIFSYDMTSIQFISKNDDTIHYKFDGEHLLLNEVPMALTSRGAQISDFTIKNLNENDYREAQHALLEFSLSMRNNFGDTSTVALSVRTLKPIKEYDSW